MVRMWAAAAALLGATVAAAADDRAPPIGFDWTGPKVTALVGYAFGRDKVSDPAYFLPLSGKADVNGVLGGIGVGYDVQFGYLLVGALTDLEVSSASGKGDLNLKVAPGFGHSGGADAGLQGSVRVRAGVAMDRVLVYGTGGLAWANYDLSFGYKGKVAEVNRTLTGWTLGGGVEYAVTDRLIARFEYRHDDLGSASGSIQDCCAPAPNRQVHDLASDTMRLGISYKF